MGPTNFGPSGYSQDANLVMSLGLFTVFRKPYEAAREGRVIPTYLISPPLHQRRE
jgi:hypothetical protein